jgi:DNA-binding beta-propeller fold protein YncE/phospholipase C
MRWLTIALAAGAAAHLFSQPVPRERVGPRPDGSFLLNSGWILSPAGRQVPLSTFPMASALSRDGRRLVILQGGYLPPELSVHDAKTLAELDRKPVEDAWLGLAFAPKGNLFYAGGGSRAAVYEFELTAEGKIEPRRTFPVVRPEKRQERDFIGDVKLSPDGRLIYAAALFRDSILVINPQTGMVIEEWKTVARPYRILFHPGGAILYVTGWANGRVDQLDVNSGRRIGVTLLGQQPMDMIWSKNPALDAEDRPIFPLGRVFVALSGTNDVVAMAVNEDGTLRPVERINVVLAPLQPLGSTPSGLALSADEEMLFVVCSDLNAVAVVDISREKSKVAGFVPVGSYPVAARALPGGNLMVLNGRGGGSSPDPAGPKPPQRVAVRHAGRSQPGSASVMAPFSEATLDEYTRTVMRNSPYTGRRAEARAGHWLATEAGRQSPVRHVVYISQDSRTYDQVLGDLGAGAGDPSLTLFGEQVTPNQHKLAREFVLLDNFYVNADVGAEGSNWSAAAIAPAYVQHLWPNSYAGRRRLYDYEGAERAAAPPAGYLWTNALARGLTVRNYGWWVDLVQPAPKEGRQVASVRDPALAPHTSMDYRGRDPDYPDIGRAQVFLKELAQFEKEGNFPRLTLLRLGGGAAAERRPSRACASGGDYALGTIVEGLSHSRFWKDMAIFVLQDETQNGADHVGPHRSPAFVISPYTRGRGADSTMYNTLSMLRTMELILGMEPMTLHDAGARPMYGAFTQKPDPAPYAAEKPRVPLDEPDPRQAALGAPPRRHSSR